MPLLIGLAYGPPSAFMRRMRPGSCSLVAALRLVWGWTKSFPVSIGQPGLRVIVAGDRDRRLRPAAR